MVRLLVLMTLTLGGELSAQVHTAPRHQASASGECVGTLKAYKVRRAVVKSVLVYKGQKNLGLIYLNNEGV